MRSTRSSCTIAAAAGFFSMTPAGWRPRHEIHLREVVDRDLGTLFLRGNLGSR